MMLMKTLMAAAVVTAGIGAATAASAAVNLVQNGDFNAPGADTPILLNGFSTFITGWTSTDTYTAYIPAGQTPDQTWECCLLGSAGPGYAIKNGLVGPPSGDASVVLDGDPNYNNAGLYQKIGGLQSGKAYTLSFWYAGSQEYSVGGPTTQWFQVSLGDQAWDSPTMDVPSQGFFPWTKFSATFTWDGIGDTLTFLAIGSPSGEPPFPMLADVSLTAAVPELSLWAMIVAGFAGLGFVARARSKGMAGSA